MSLVTTWSELCGSNVFLPRKKKRDFRDGTAVLPEWYQPHLNGTPLNSWVHEADPMDCCCCGVVKLLGAHPELVGDTKETLYGDVGNMAVFHNLLLDEKKSILFGFINMEFLIFWDSLKKSSVFQWFPVSDHVI